MNKGTTVGLMLVLIGGFFLFTGIFNLVFQQMQGWSGSLRPSEIMAYTMTIGGFIVTMIGAVVAYVMNKK